MGSEAQPLSPCELELLNLPSIPQIPHHLLELVDAGVPVFLAFLHFADDFLGGAGDEVFVGKLRVDLLQFVLRLVALLAEALAFGSDVDEPFEGQVDLADRGEGGRHALGGHVAGRNDDFTSSGETGEDGRLGEGTLFGVDDELHALRRAETVFGLEIAGAADRFVDGGDAGAGLGHDGGIGTGKDGLGRRVCMRKAGPPASP